MVLFLTDDQDKLLGTGNHTFQIKMAQTLDLRCVLLPATITQVLWGSQPKHASNPLLNMWAKPHFMYDCFPRQPRRHEHDTGAVRDGRRYLHAVLRHHPSVLPVKGTPPSTPSLKPFERTCSVAWGSQFPGWFLHTTIVKHGKGCLKLIKLCFHDGEQVSLLSGRWAHNTGAISTTQPGWCSEGVFYKGKGQQHALPTYISTAGVATGIFGKETNANDGGV